MSTPEPTPPPGSRFAMSVLHPGAPMLQIRYRQGVLMTPEGFPDWPLCARAIVELPPPGPELTLDEVRVVDVLAANLAMVRAATEPDPDPLWAPPGGDTGPAVATPPGWCWAHVAPSRQLALVPIELHGSFRHAGGVRRLPVTARGLRLDPGPVPAAPAAGEAVPDEVLALLERALDWPLPPAYRRFLAETNGAGPVAPAVMPGHGLIADQPLFGIGRADRAQDLSQVWDWMRDRLTVDFLPIGYVQGGLLAVRVSGDDLDSIWYWDDDDRRDSDRYDAEHICAHLLHRCADTIDGFWAALAQPSGALLRTATEQVDNGLVRQLREDGTGAGLPPRMRAPWQPRSPSGPDPVARLFEAR